MRSRRTPAISASLLVLFFTGCANTSSIQPAGSSRSGFDGAVFGGESVTISTNAEGAEEYRVFHQGATGFVSVQGVREDAELRGAEFCGRQGKAMKPLRETTSTPPHILGNFPRIEIVFACVEKQNSEVPVAIVDAKYTKLVNLKKLLDSGVITQAEFEREKAKILSQP